MHFLSSMFASAYAGLSPMNNQTVICFFNGQAVPCGKGIFWGLVWLSPFVFCLTFILSILTVAGIWKIFTKAGKPGWASIVPIYNIIIMLEIVRKPLWWIFLYFIPLVNIIVGLIVVFELAKEFGKGIGYILGLIFLPFIFYPMLGFGKAQYHPAK